MSEKSAQKSINDLISGASCLDDYDPNWPAHAAAALGADPEFERWPQQYGWWLTRREGLLKKVGFRR